MPKWESPTDYTCNQGTSFALSIANVLMGNMETENPTE